MGEKIVSLKTEKEELNINLNQIIVEKNKRLQRIEEKQEKVEKLNERLQSEL